MLNIPVILGSVREGRKSEAPAKYLVEKLKSAGHESRLVDFKELPLPFFDSPLVPVALKGTYPYPNVQKWSEIAKSADAFILVASEYNHGYTAVLKNALDWLYMEFEKKPFGLVGVSSGSLGGIRATEQLRPIIENFGAVAIRETILFSEVDKVIDAQCNLLDASYDGKIDRFIKALDWWAEALKDRRYVDKK